MHVFVTGATGWVGAAVVDELLHAGHQVSGLARSQAGAEALAGRGATVLRGTLEDLALLARGAAAADAVIHTAFNHDFSRFAENCALDERAIHALGKGLEGSGRSLLVTSGMALLGSGGIATEADPAPARSPAMPRVSEAAAAQVAAHGVVASAVRLPPSVHGLGDHGFVARLVALAREKGVSAYIGSGQNHWAAVHRRDAARVYRLALEHGVQAGPFHAVQDQGICLREIAEAIGRGLGVPVVSVSQQEAAAHFGWFATFAGIDVVASSTRTRELLGWQPTECTLLDDLAQGHYFAQA